MNYTHDRDKIWCDICGYRIAAWPPTEAHRWYNDIRYLYTSNPSMTGVLLSDKILDQDVPYDLTRPEIEDNKLQDRHVWVIPFHDACWNVLQDEVFGTANIPLDRLFQLCVSSRRLHTSLFLDDLIEEDGCNIPYDAGYVSDLRNERHPRDTTWIGEIVEYAQDRYYREEPLSDVFSQELFSTLPREIIKLIIAYLSTDDFLLLRRTSRVFALEGFSREFWVSRFRHGHEFSHLHYIMKVQDYTQYAERLYLILTWSYCGDDPPNTQFQDYLWRAAEAIHGILKEPQKECRGLLIDKSDELVQRLSFSIASRRLGTSYGPLDTLLGARAICSREIELPRHVSEVWVSMMNLNKKSHVCGLRFCGEYGEATIGFLNSSEELLEVRQGAYLCGFDLVLCLDGIAAIALVYDDGTTSKLIGDVSDQVVFRLLPEDPIGICLRASFDTVRMLDLAVSQYRPDKQPYNPKINIPWYPNLPQMHHIIDGVHYHHDLFPDQVFSLILFGGEDGELLSKLVAIKAVESHDDHVLRRLEFTYREGEWTWSKRIKWQWPSIMIFEDCEDDETDEEYNNNEHHNNSPRDTTSPDLSTTFVIDGPGGERICDVRKGLYRGELRSILIRTNRGREADFGNRDDHEYDLSINGKTIIGFVGSVYDSGTDYELGVVSIADEA